MSENRQDGMEYYRRFLNGDANALERLVQAYSDALVRFAYCYVKDSAAAEDIMEDAFAALIVKRRSFSTDSNLRAYLYKTVRNKSVDYLRAHKKQISISDVENVLVSTDGEEDVVRRVRNRAVYRCLTQLPPQYEEVLYLTYFEGYTPEEVCKIVKRNKKQVYNLLARAKASLKELLQKEGISHEDV